MIMANKTYAIPGGILNPGKYNFPTLGPAEQKTYFSVDADVDTLELLVDCTNVSNPATSVQLKLFVSYDSGVTEQGGGGGGFQGGLFPMTLEDGQLSNFYGMQVGFDTTQPKNKRVVRVEVVVNGGAVVIGSVTLNATKV
jgi:hypothetical protein